MSDEPEIPVPPEPTTFDILKALLAQKESLNRAINKSAPSTAPQAPPVQVFDDCDQYAEDSPDPGQPFEFNRPQPALPSPKARTEMEKWLKEQGEQLAKLQDELQKVKGLETMGSTFRD